MLFRSVRPTTVEADALPITELGVDFVKNEDGHLVFTLDVPNAAAKTVKQTSWQLWLGSLRFATGIEGATSGEPSPNGGLRVKVIAPLVYRHLTWVEGSAYLQARLRAEVELSPSLTVVRFSGEREVLVHGKPVLDEIDE